MVLPSDATLRLIQWLANREPEQLWTLASDRNLRVADLQSLTTMALALNDDTNVARTLSRLDRKLLQEISALAQGTPCAGAVTELSALGLVDCSLDPPQLLCGESQVAKTVVLDSARTPPVVAAAEPVGAREYATAGTAVEILVCHLDDLLALIARNALPITREGAPSASTQKLLVEILGDTLDPALLVRLLLVSGLVENNKSDLTLSPKASTWRTLPRVEQWHTIAQAWWESTPSWLGHLVREFPNAHWVQGLPGLVEYHYPLLGDAGSVQKLEPEARTLGVIAAGRPTPWGTAVFKGTTPSGLEEFLPAPAPGVFAHEDFTLLAPGPLMPEHRQILDRLTTKELGGLVPRYRVTPQAILDALQVGEPAETMSSLLQETSQNPLPEGILHLLEDTIRQSQNIRLRAVGKRTIITVKTAQIAQELIADPALNALSLSITSPTELETPWPAERVHTALTSSRYVALIDHDPVAGKQQVAQAPQEESPLARAVHTLASSISSAKAQGVAPWLGSMIEVATAHKIPLEIECEMPGGVLVALVMEPRSLSNGRLRGLDIKNQMEKTIPVSSIRKIAPSAHPANTP
jgi:hypothetical protein